LDIRPKRWGVERGTWDVTDVREGAVAGRARPPDAPGACVGNSVSMVGLVAFYGLGYWRFTSIFVDKKNST
jgi:hypothetical protein